MRYPTIPVRQTSRDTTDQFRGYNHNLRIATGEFYDMENLTSDDYPVLSPRRKRGIWRRPASPQGLIAKEQLCYVDGADFIIGEDRIELGLSVAAEDQPKRLVSMGAYVVILPDKKYINTIDPEDRGDIENSVSVTGAQLSLCMGNGDNYEGITVSDNAPDSPANGAMWMDTGSDPEQLKMWSASQDMWVGLATTYIKIAAEGIGKGFERFDGITISGAGEFDGANVVQAVGDNYIVITGILTEARTIEGAVTIERKMPALDMVIESGNRLWGCRYGTANNGEMVNEIYASKLGDFKNWSCFQGLSTDSYTASCGTDGPFTGAITHMGYPLFFKEACVHKVYGSYPAEYQIQDTACRGVQRGCQDSLAIVGEVLYYKARSGICAFDGSLPVDVSRELGRVHYSRAVGGAHGSKYYVSMMDEDGGWVLFVYDTKQAMWHKEDNFQAGGFASVGGKLFAIDRGSRNIISMLGGGEEEDKVPWMAQFGEIGITSPDAKYVSRINMRLSLEPGSRLEVYAQYDMDKTWEKLCVIFGTDLRSISLPVRPRRCDHMKLKLIGEGMGKLYSMTKTIERGSLL